VRAPGQIEDADPVVALEGELLEDLPLDRAPAGREHRAAQEQNVVGSVVLRRPGLQHAPQLGVLRDQDAARIPQWNAVLELPIGARAQLGCKRGQQERAQQQQHACEPAWTRPLLRSGT
jgi:hypothetical protein